MAKSRPRKEIMSDTESISVRLDSRSKELLLRAARLRGTSVAAYVKAVSLAEAKREVRGIRDDRICLSPKDQLAFGTRSMRRRA